MKTPPPLRPLLGTLTGTVLLHALFFAGTDTALAQAVLREDFRINDENAITTVGQQQFPDISASEGGYTVVWQDDPRTGTGVGIYAQLYDRRGVAKGGTFQVDEEGTPNAFLKGPPRVARQFSQSAIGDPFGTSVFVWSDLREDINGDIWAQVYNHTAGTFIGSNFRVNDRIDGVQTDAAVAMWPAPVSSAAGRFVVVWADSRGGDSDIYARIFNRGGNPSGAGFRVNDDTGTARQSNADVGIDVNGDFVVVWRDFRSPATGLSEIWAQRYRFDGRPLGENFRVDQDVSGAVTPRIAMTGGGDFVITYTGGSGVNREVLARRYTSGGNPDGDQVTVTQNSGLHAFPNVMFLLGSSVRPDFMVSWHTRETTQLGGDIYLQTVDGRGRLIGDNVLVNTVPKAAHNRPALATLGFGNTNPPNSRTMLVWQDERIGDADIWAQLFINRGNPDGPNYLVNGRTFGATNQTAVALDTTPDGRTFVVWEDDRRVAAGVDIYGKRLDRYGDPLGPDFRFNDDPGGADQAEPDIAARPDGGFVAVWTDDRRESEGDIYLQVFAPNGKPVESNVLVNDPNVPARQSAPAIALDVRGGFVVTWRDTRNEANGQIFAQRFDASADPVGGNFRVDADRTEAVHRDPDIAMDRSGAFVIVWADARGGDLDIWGQRYHPDGTADGINFLVNARPNAGADEIQMLPAIDIAPGGDLFITWLDYVENPKGDIWGTGYNREGTRITRLFRINDVEDVANPFPFEYLVGPSVSAVPLASATTNGNVDNSFVVSWSDFRAGLRDPDVYAQRYDSVGERFGRNLRVDAAPEGSWQLSPQVARDALPIRGLYFGWTDDRHLATEWQSAWGKILAWDDAPAPSLTIERRDDKVQLSWPAVEGYLLESSIDLTPEMWFPVPEMSVGNGLMEMVILDISEEPTFFRLHRRTRY